MSDQNTQDAPQQEQQVSSTSSQTENSENMIPQSRFNEVNSKYRELQAELDKLRQESEQKRQQELTEQEKWKELYEEAQAKLQQFDSVQTQAQTYREQLEANNQARIARIPEDKRHLVPDYDDPVKMSAYLDRAIDDLVGAQSKPTPPNLNGGSGSSGASEASRSAIPPEQQTAADIASQFGYNINTERFTQLAKKRSSRSNNQEG